MNLRTKYITLDTTLGQDKVICHNVWIMFLIDNCMLYLHIMNRTAGLTHVISAIIFYRLHKCSRLQISHTYQGLNDAYSILTKIINFEFSGILF